MKRRNFLKTLGGLSLAGFGPLKTSKLQARPPGTSRKKPNILFILTDQQHHQAISALGNSLLSTPNMDSLVASGTTFEQAYCPNPVCMPSRSAMFSGRMPTETGVYVNTVHQPSGGQIDRDLPSLGDWFSRQGGYETVYAGKYHLPQSNTFQIPGFDVLAAGFAHRGSPGDATVARACEAWLLNRRPSSQPFFMVCSLVNPHDVCHWLSINTASADHEKRYPRLADLSQLPPLPPNFSFSDLGEARPQADIRMKQQPTSGKWNADDWRYYLWSYYRQVEMVDAEIGRVLGALKESGAERDTLILMTSDHGEGLAEHQMVRKGFLYDSATRVPLVIRTPGQTKAVRISQTLVSGIDLMPTLCGQAGISKPDGLTHARDLSPILTDSSGLMDRSYLVIEENDSIKSAKSSLPKVQKGVGRAVRSNRFKYITYDGSTEEQLFDMVADPGESINLAAKENFSGELNAHRQMLVEWESTLQISSNVPSSPWATAS
jgi:arylsulfatase A-like enzyme